MKRSGDTVIKCVLLVPVAVHILSYTIAYLNISKELAWYFYWIANSTTLLFYSTCVYFLISYKGLFKSEKLNYRFKIFYEDWIAFGLMDVCRQLMSDYTPSMAWQWIIFITVITLQELRYFKWKRQKRERIC